MDSIYELIDQIERQDGTEGVRCGTTYTLPKGGQAVVTAVGKNRVTIELTVHTASEGKIITGKMEPLGLNRPSDFHGPVNPS